jgi:hypothetical protein
MAASRLLEQRTDGMSDAATCPPLKGALMQIDSVRELKARLIEGIVDPLADETRRVRSAGVRAVTSTEMFGVSARSRDTVQTVQRSLALGIAPGNGAEFKLAVRVQRPSLIRSALVDNLVKQARGEADVRLIGRIDKRAARKHAAKRQPSVRAVLAAPWYQLDTRPLLIGASVGHIDITAGTIGGFARLGETDCILSNNHVLANEDHASRGDWVLQRAKYDGGASPAQRAGQLSYWIRLKKTGANFVDAALAALKPGIGFDPSRLRELVNGQDRKLAGVATTPVDEGRIVYKTGRTTGATKGRVTAFDLDNVVVKYDVGNLRFDDQIEIEGAGDHAFSDGGDSGSLIVNEDMLAIGLLFAGGDAGGTNGLGLTYANPIGRVLVDLGATLLS